MWGRSASETSSSWNVSPKGVGRRTDIACVFSVAGTQYESKQISRSVLCTEIHPGWPLATVVGLAFAAAGVFAP